MNWGQAAKNWGQLGAFAGKAAWANRTGRGAIIGAGAGAAYGMMSDDTSMLGGALKGAALGGVGARYLGAGRAWSKAGGGGMLGGYPRGIASQARLDYRRASRWMGGTSVATNRTGGAAMGSAMASAPTGATMASNQGFNEFKGIHMGRTDRWNPSSEWAATQSPRKRRWFGRG